jgi:hypothetical protein
MLGHGRLAPPFSVLTLLEPRNNPGKYRRGGGWGRPYVHSELPEKKGGICVSTVSIVGGYERASLMARALSRVLLTVQAGSLSNLQSQYRRAPEREH